MNINSVHQKIKETIPSIQDIKNAAEFTAGYIASGAITSALFQAGGTFTSNFYKGPFYSLLESIIAPGQFNNFVEVLPMAIKGAKCSSVAIATLPLTYAVTKSLISKVNDGLQECGRLAGIQNTFSLPVHEGAALSALFAAALANHYLNPDLTVVTNTMNVLLLGIAAPVAGVVLSGEIKKIATEILLPRIRNSL